MPSLTKQLKSPYWFACFTLPDGRRTKRSTGTEDKREATRIALEFDKAASEGRKGRFTEARARKTISDIYALANKDKLPSSTIRDFLKSSWLKRKEMESDERTVERYTTAIDHCLEHLGAKSGKDLLHLSSKDVSDLRDSIANSLSANSANFTVKVLRTALNQARRDGLIEVNEASRVTLIKKRANAKKRRPFTLPELKRIVDVADNEWRGIIFMGLYTGLRLGDICALTWARVNLHHEQIALESEKTGRQVIIPIVKPLLLHLQQLPSSDNPNSPVFPETFERKLRNPHGGGISNQFYEILVRAGLAVKRNHKAKGKGRNVQRAVSEISFHSLRHTATSLLKQAGVGEAVTMDIIGHNSPAISQNYTKIDEATKRKALNLLPDVTSAA